MELVRSPSVTGAVWIQINKDCHRNQSQRDSQTLERAQLHTDHEKKMSGKRKGRHRAGRWRWRSWGDRGDFPVKEGLLAESLLNICT